VSCSWHEQLPVQSLHLIHHDLLSRSSKGAKCLNRYLYFEWVENLGTKGNLDSIKPHIASGVIRRSFKTLELGWPNFCQEFSSGAFGLFHGEFYWVTLFGYLPFFVDFRVSFKIGFGRFAGKKFQSCDL